MDLLDRFVPRENETGSTCECTVSIDEVTGTPLAGDDRRVVTVTADDCPGDGDLASEPDCRQAVIRTLADCDATRIRVRTAGRERLYTDTAAGFLLAAGQFVERASFHDPGIAEMACTDPLGAAREAAGRAGPIARIAAETGLLEGHRRAEGYEDVLASRIGITIGRSHVDTRPPPEASLLDRRTLPTGEIIRRYETPDGDEYHLTPVTVTLSPRATTVLTSAHALLADGTVTGGDRAPGRAVRRAAEKASDDGKSENRVPVETLTGLLCRYTRGYGVLEGFFADPNVSDVVATAPVTENPLRVVVDGDRLGTNVHLTRNGAATLASRFRRTSGRAFSRASPTLDAVIEPVTGGRIRVAGVTRPASEGYGFAFRSHGDDGWTLPGLIANGTLSAAAAAVLSVVVERGAAGLVAGPRGAGKTTLLGALLWELPPQTRTVVIEDTPELPVERLRETDRDVQGIRTEVQNADGPALAPETALRTALRLGEGALVVGEVRGEEAQVLYEAMRVGANGSAVLGTIHGDGAQAVRRRVVDDLGVPPSSFGATDFVVTCGVDDSRHVTAIEEVHADAERGFTSLFERSGEVLDRSGPIDRGNSHLIANVMGPGESYATVRERLHQRERNLRSLAETDQTRPAEVVRAYRRQRNGETESTREGVQS